MPVGALGRVAIGGGDAPQLNESIVVASREAIHTAPMFRAPAALLAGIGFAGCLRQPVFHVDKDAGGDGDGDGGVPPPGMATTVQAGAVIVTGPFYEMRFSAQGTRYPESLSIRSSTNVFAIGDSLCGTAGGTGVAVSPAFTLNGDIGRAAEPAIEYSGGAVAKVVVSWSNPFTCSGFTNSPIGTSTFTFFPSGQIIRDDSIAFTGANVLPAGCTCADSAQFLVNSYWVFHRPELPLFPEPAIAGSDIPTVLNSVQVCAATTEHSILLGFPGTSAPATSHMVLTDGTGGAGYALASEIIPPADTIATVQGRITTQMLLDPEGEHCLELSDHMLVLRNPTFRVSATEVGGGNEKLFMISSRDGIYGGDAADVEPVADTIELRASATTQTIPPPFAIKLTFLGARSRIRVSRSASEYLVTRPSATTAVLYFVGALSDVPITVTAEP